MRSSARTALLLVGCLASAAAGQVVEENITYSSSIDPCRALAAHLAYPAAGRALPVLVLMHGFRMRADGFHADAYQRIAAAGSFVIGVEMRGRGASDCKPDAGGREIYDIVDAIRCVLGRYPDRTDSGQIHVAGYSGGGGNALSCAARFPDTFNTVASFFGISDYGYDPRDGWYHAASADQRKYLALWIGGTPAEAPDAYHSRAQVLAIANYSGGHLWLFHDREDRNVPVVNSERVEQAMRAAGLHNCTASYTGPGDDPRWLHASPNGNAGVIRAEALFLTPIVKKSVPPWTVPERGTLRVAAYLETKRFGLWLGDGTAAFGSVDYDVPRREFTIRWETRPREWSLTLERQPTGTAVRARINGRWYTARGDAQGRARFQP